MALLTPEDVAQQLAMSLSWVYANKHRIGYHQIGTAIRFEPKDVAAYSEGCKRGPQTGGRNTWESLSATGRSETGGLSRKRTTVSDINKRLQGLEKGSARRTSTRPSAKLN
ncbi:helix-turn-helix domain-containing protein [Halomonas sp. I1]|uniref:helix-turn-helix domain-containing protein n=1 Tax=Halomonas sp. I1 TaxID=393536 RepID=UPI0028DDABFF|nr:helix-turn-helix domain-containing protein [Halomonas sp. I1]MDT8895436.1 helix-turn-helix domain-containing protein [Halomonas sp. I1]